MTSMMAMLVLAISGTVSALSIRCVDNDARLADIAVMTGYSGVPTCAQGQVRDYCTNQGRKGDIIRSLCCATCSKPVCMDDDAKIARLAVEAGVPGVSGCIDVGDFCRAGGRRGEVVRNTCCQTCNNHGLPITSLPPADGETVDVFLLSGQSECVGQADPKLLDQGELVYQELTGSQEGVWFAGYASPASTDRFFVANMQAGDEKKTFGPEISIGQRIREVTDKRVLIVKYCWGGSSVKQHWNPDTPDNTWDRAADDGTSAWLENHGVDFTDKNKLFINMAYSVRRAVEALQADGVSYEWKGIFWVQGQADSKSTWEEYGQDLARLWDAMRETIGVPDLPIVDTGSGSQHNLRSGKAYAGQLVQRCKVSTVEIGASSVDPNSTCVVSATNPCMNSTFFNFDYSNFYGYDPQFPEELKPDGASDKVFRKWKNFPYNLHSEVDAMVLKGRMLANEYVRAFSSSSLPAALENEDPSFLFPWPACPAGMFPSSDYLCWIDERDQYLQQIVCNPNL